MSSLVAEKWVCINGSDVFHGIEISKLDTALLMSLLEESNGSEEYNEEQLNRVIKSLEAEINEPNMVLKGDHDLAMEPGLLLSDEEDGQNCLASMDFDMEQLVASSQSDDMNWSYYYKDQCGLDLDNFVEYDVIVSGDYSGIYNSVSSENHGFSSL